MGIYAPHLRQTAAKQGQNKTLMTRSPCPFLFSLPDMTGALRVRMPPCAEDSAHDRIFHATANVTTVDPQLFVGP